LNHQGRLLAGVGIDFLGSQSGVGIFILLVLLFFLASSLGILFERLLYFRRARAESRRFLVAFRRATRFSDVKSLSEELRWSPLVGLFLAGYNELAYQLKAAAGASTAASGEPPRTSLPNVDAVSRALLRASSLETNKLERTVNFLATTASVTPFIGLLGTVYGIMTAFKDIGLTGKAGIAVVAPGIAEALVTTAAGLAAAIPAAIGFNLLINQIKGMASEMDDFSLEFVSIAERQLGD